MYFLFTTPMLRAVLFATIFALPSLADFVQNDWSDPEAPDFTTTLTQGDIFVIEWTSSLEPFFVEYCSECDPTNVELWIIGTDNSNSQQISSGINVSSTLSYSWTVDVPSQSTTRSSWVFRFIPSLEIFKETQQQISSAAFYILDDTPSPSATAAATTQQTTSSSSAATKTTLSQKTISSSSFTTLPTSVHTTASKASSTASSAASSTASSTASSSASASSLPQSSNSSKSSTPVGAIAGGVAGGAISVALIAGLCIFGRRKGWFGHRHNSSSLPSHYNSPSTQALAYQPQHMAQAPVQYASATSTPSKPVYDKKGVLITQPHSAAPAHKKATGTGAKKTAKPKAVAGRARV